MNKTTSLAVCLGLTWAGSSWASNNTILGDISEGQNGRKVALHSAEGIPVPVHHADPTEHEKKEKSRGELCQGESY